MGKYITNCLLGLTNNALQHSQVYKVNKEAIINNKKNPNRWIHDCEASTMQLELL